MSDMDCCEYPDRATTDDGNSVRGQNGCICICHIDDEGNWHDE